jgi:hypothetical protein
MSLPEKVLDLPVLLQGALGSFLFLVIYEVGKRVTNAALTVTGKFKKRIRKELGTAEWLHHAHSVLDGSAQIRATLASLLLAVNRILHALIFACLGAVSLYFVGSLAVVAYLIALGYLYLALRAAHVDFGPAQSKEFHEKQMARVRKEAFPDVADQTSPKSEA